MTTLAISPIATYLPTVEWMVVTPGLAEEWLGRNERNRSKRRAHLDGLERDLSSGRYLITGDTIKFDWNGRLIDGQHRLTAIVTSGVSMTILVVRGLDPRVQDVLDTNAKRSGSDALYFHGVEGWRTLLAALARLDMTRSAGRLTSALDTYMVSPTNSEIIEWHAENPDADWAAQFASKHYKMIKSSPTALAYAVLVTSRIDMDACIEFFTSSAELRTDGTGDPRLTMMRTFDRDSQPGRKKASTAAQISYIFRSWNAWREGRKISKLPLVTHGDNASVSIPEPK